MRNPNQACLSSGGITNQALLDGTVMNGTTITVVQSFMMRQIEGDRVSEVIAEEPRGLPWLSPQPLPAATDC